MNARLICTMLLAALAAAGQSVVPNHVTLPLDEYNRLLEAAGKPPRRTDAPPMPYVIQNAEWKLRVEGENVAGTLQLRGEVLQKGQIKAPLVSGLTVLDARQNARPLPLVQENGTLAAVLSGPTDFLLSLDVALPLGIEAGRAQFTLPAIAAGTAAMELTVPGEFTAVNLASGLIVERGSNAGKTTVQATLTPGRPASAWWASRLAPPPVPTTPKEVRFLSDVKTLLTVNEAELTMQSLANLTILQGEPAQFAVEIPAGYEVTGATGATLAASEMRGGKLVLQVNNPASRTHQFLISVTKPLSDGKADLSLPGFAASQRETGELLIEGVGTMELAAAERGGLRRMDMKEGSPQLRALAKYPAHAAFRYQKKAQETPGVAMEWVRFPDTPVLAAVASQAVVTTLVTSEGRSLTEVKLTVKNREQTFVKVTLPAGAQILSAEVAGEKVKPVTAPDGDRVPLLRPGFRPSGEYTVSYVFLHAGTPFAKKGGSELTLPKMDVPVGLVAWEVFLPKQYQVADFGGDAIPARLLPVAAVEHGSFLAATNAPVGAVLTGAVELDTLEPGQLGGYVVDASGAAVPGAMVTVEHAGWTERTRSDGAGRWLITTVPSGRVKIRVESSGFRVLVQEIDYDRAHPRRLSFRLLVGAVNETVEVTSNASILNKESQQIEKQARQNAALKDVEASVNVAELQKRVVGVLPIAVNVPRTGNSYRFVRPLVVDEETRLTFNYRAGK